MVTEVAEGDLATESWDGAALVLMSRRAAGDGAKECAPDDGKTARALGEADAPHALADDTTSWSEAAGACGEAGTAPPGGGCSDGEEAWAGDDGGTATTGGRGMGARRGATWRGRGSGTWSSGGGGEGAPGASCTLERKGNTSSSK
jgi:hypothetical protein